MIFNNLARDYQLSLDALEAVTGVHSMHKALLNAILLPYAEMKKLQDESNFGKLMFVSERFKTMPFGEVWAEYLRRYNLSQDWYGEVETYEKDVLSLRK